MEWEEHIKWKRRKEAKKTLETWHIMYIVIYTILSFCIIWWDISSKCKMGNTSFFIFSNIRLFLWQFPNEILSKNIKFQFCKKNPSDVCHHQNFLIFQNFLLKYIWFLLRIRSFFGFSWKTLKCRIFRHSNHRGAINSIKNIYVKEEKGNLMIIWIKIKRLLNL